jgi:hypothetical protein
MKYAAYRSPVLNGHVSARWRSASSIRHEPKAAIVGAVSPSKDRRQAPCQNVGFACSKNLQSVADNGIPSDDAIREWE